MDGAALLDGPEGGSVKKVKRDEPIYGRHGKMYRRKCATCKRSKGVIAFPRDDRDPSRCVNCHDRRACQ
jgi:hypothetical protein